MKDIKKITSIVIIVLLVITTFAGCSPKSKKEITFANAGWESNMFHNAVAGLVAKEVYGYDWREIPGTTPVTYEGVIKNEIKVRFYIIGR